MKKLLLVIALLLVPNYALAATYYINGDSYYYSNNYEDDFAAEEIRYKFYKENKVYSDQYYLEGENDIDYPLKSDKYIITDESPYSVSYPSSEPNRLIKTKTVYKYGMMDKVRYLYLYDISGSDGSLRFLEFNVFNGDSKINYNIIGNHGKLKDIINNDIIKENYVTINGDLLIDLGDYYDLEKLNIKTYLTDPIGNSNSVLKIKCGVTSNQYLDFVNVTIDVKMNNMYSDYYVYDINLKDYIKDPEYSKIFDSGVKLDEYNLIETYNLYSYQDKKYLYYKIEKDYLEDYYVNYDSDGYIKDDSDYKIFYKIRDKYKLELNDNYVINNYEYNLKDMILYSDVDINKLNISSNIVIDKNGIYEVIISYNDFEIKKYVSVNIKKLSNEIITNSDNNVSNISLGVSNNVKTTIKNKVDESKINDCNKLQLSSLPLPIIIIFTAIALIYYKICHKLTIKSND